MGVLKFPVESVARLPSCYPEDVKVPCIVLAGYERGSPTMIRDVRGQTFKKHTVPLMGRSQLERNIATLRNSGRVSRIFLVGEDEDIAPVAKKYSPEMVWTVQQASDLSKNIERSMKKAREYNEFRAEAIVKDGGALIDDRVLVVTADSLLTQDSIDWFLDVSGRHDVVVGAADQADFSTMLSDLELAIYCPRIKMNFFPVGDRFLRSHRMIRPNNMYLLRPKAIQDSLYWLMDQVYEHRQFVDEDGNTRRSPLYEMVKRSKFTLSDYQRRRGISWPGKARLNLYGVAAALMMSMSFPAYSRFAFTRRDIEIVFTQNFGLSCELFTHPKLLHPVIDIDVQAMYDFLAGPGKDFEPYKRIMQYTPAAQ